MPFHIFLVLDLDLKKSLRILLIGINRIFVHMDVYSLPLPQDSKKDSHIDDTIGDIKDELLKLQEKYGRFSIPILKDVERLLSIYEGRDNKSYLKKENCNIEKVILLII